MPQTQPFHIFNLDGISLIDSTLTFEDDGNDFQFGIKNYTTPQMFGAKGDGITDDYDAIIRMFATRPKLIYWGAFGTTYRITRPLIINFRCHHIGDKPKIIYDWRVQGYTYNMVRIDPGAEFSLFEGIIFDHDSENATQPWLYSGVELVFLDAVRCGCDDVHFHNIEVHRSGINGLSIQKSINQTGDGLTQATALRATHVSFFPLRNKVRGCYFYRCGYIEVVDRFVITPNPLLLTKGGGAGINILSGSRTVVSDCHMNMCSIGFTLDFAAGAVSNVIENLVIESSGQAYPFASNAGNGWGSWIGAPQNNISNVTIIGSLRHGLVVDNNGRNSNFTNIMSYANYQHGYWIGSNHCNFVNCKAISNSLEAPNTYDGFNFNVGAANFTGMSLIGCTSQSDTNTQRYGLYMNRTTGDVTGTSVGSSFTGQTGNVNLNGSTLYNII